ncbi:TonB family protein [Novosphingobium sp. RD2P27]|uniref:TonB family protein n=1 Tax=Novosphingobium kalidii TaxID=3230299 RepID=A0ABV2D1F6_9SPHN
MAASILLNLGIFVAFAAFATITDTSHQTRATVTAFDIGAASPSQSGSTQPPAPAQSPAPTAEPAVTRAQEPVLQVRPEQLAHPARQMADTTSAPFRLNVQTTSDAPMRLGVMSSLTDSMLALQTANLVPNPAREVSAAEESDSYGASIKQHLLRFRRQNTVGPGSTFIHFIVLADGTVADVGVAQSSGSSRFDREAMQIVRRAAPFPHPPGGNSRSFNLEFTGR